MVILGFRRIKALALTVATGMYLRKATEVEELRKFWRYSLACAFLSEEMARACSLPEDIAYTDTESSRLEEKDLWDMPGLFLLIVGLASAEWMLRKRKGLA